MSTNATLDRIRSYRTSVTTALLDQHRRKGLTVDATTVPMFREPSTVPARPAQSRYLADLLGRLEIHAPSVHAQAIAWVATLGVLDRTDASRAIDAVKRHLAAPAELATLLDGIPVDRRYALDRSGDGDWRFYRLHTVGGVRTLSIGHADGHGISWTPLSPGAQLAAARGIAKDAHGAMLNFGRKIGKCGHCGRVLTSRSSREAGIGPICQTK